MFTAKAHNRLQVHMLKTYAASNLNRDDLGAPKEVIFGGARRLRVSSQSIKRSVRVSEVFDSFRAYSAEEYGAAGMVRTGLVAQLLRERLIGTQDDVIATTIRWINGILAPKAQEKADKEKSEKAKTKAKAAAAGDADDAGAAEENDKEQTQLVAFSERELDIVADAVRHLTKAAEVVPAINEVLADRKKASKGAISELAGDYSIEAQLFGRMMTASAGFIGIDSPLQVAHPMTTHAVAVQRDYWTGVDDVKVATGVAGSGMIDVRRFGAGTFYIYSCLDLDLLITNLRRAFAGMDEQKIRAMARDTAIAWLQGLALSNPTGYQNSFAAHDLPSTVAIEIGSSFPYSAAKAFEKPVEGTDGYEAPSIERLVAWEKARRATYGAYIHPLQGYGLNELNTDSSLEALIVKAGAAIDAIFAEQEGGAPVGTDIAQAKKAA